MAPFILDENKFIYQTTIFVKTNNIRVVDALIYMMEILAITRTLRATSA